MTNNNNEHSNGKIKVFLVDDHTILCDTLVKFINLENDILVCGTASDADNALDRICQAKPDVVIVDLMLDETSGLVLIKDVATKIPNLPILVLSMLDETIYGERALQAGARGYIMKNAPGDRVLKGIRNLAAGKNFISEELTGKMLDKMVGGQKGKSCSPCNLLTNRELEIFCMTGNGQNSKQIANKLHISAKTVETHHYNIKNKLDLKNINELIECAVKWVLNKA